MGRSYTRKPACSCRRKAFFDTLFSPTIIVRINPDLRAIVLRRRSAFTRAFVLSAADAARSVGRATLDKDWVMTLADWLGASDVEAADIAKMVDHVSLTTSAGGSYRAGLEYIDKNPKEGVHLVEFLTGAGSDIADFGNLYVHPTAAPAT